MVREAPPESLKTSEISLRSLNPENPQDREVARQLDLASLEALNPFALTPEEAHEKMSETQLTRWMTDRGTGMLRVVEQKGKAVGFVYLYNDAKHDTDFQNRVQAVRSKENLPANHPVWEMNFWFYPETKDYVVKTSVQEALSEFAKTRARETTTIMFADAGDLKEAYRESVNPRATLKEISKKSNRPVAEGLFQDTTVLLSAGFHFVDRLRYDKDSVIKDFAYALRIAPKLKNP